MKSNKLGEILSLSLLSLSSAGFLGVQSNTSQNTLDYLERVESNQGLDVAKFKAENILYKHNNVLERIHDFGIRSAANDYLERN